MKSIIKEDRQPVLGGQAAQSPALMNLNFGNRKANLAESEEIEIPTDEQGNQNVASGFELAQNQQYKKSLL